MTGRMATRRATGVTARPGAREKTSDKFSANIFDGCAWGRYPQETLEVGKIYPDIGGKLVVIQPTPPAQSLTGQGIQAVVTGTQSRPRHQRRVNL